MREIAIIRSIEGRLAWYPPGSSDGPQWLDQESGQASLRGIIAQRKLMPVFAVPGEDTRLLRLQIAAEERRHLATSLPFMLEEELSQDIDEVHFATCALDRLDFAVAVCSKENMNAYQSSLASYPGVTQWLPEPLLLPWQEDEWCLVLEGDRAIVRTGACEGFSVEREMLSLMLHALTLEGAAPTAIIMYGQDQEADAALVDETLRDRVQWRQGDLYAAMLIAESPDPALNLRQGEWAVRLPLARWWQHWRAAAVLFGVAVLVHLFATWSDYRHLKQENLALRGAVQSSYRQAFPKGAVVDAEKQLRRQLQTMTGSSEASGFVSLMARVGEVVATADGSIVSINYNDKSGEMRLNLLAADYEAVERIRTGIAERGLQATLENSSAQGERVRARMRVGDRS
ncbi:type II secretion system protein GspL [Halieaceae bacterium IMCC8485]|uniref:Type II secretion system protein L n=1 Tax=Candidatus Seongchinamella marina TaxID=2518990 RepID=A0ABT3SQJ3_9GAMM|nr:type II secretion system protein GspL [Candidatus Seongchinamella marina]MCX2972250.1 type II secretion system protein GspL [Candidatus Seongchinamella marina]